VLTIFLGEGDETDFASSCIINRSTATFGSRQLHSGVSNIEGSAATLRGQVEGSNIGGAEAWQILS